MTQAVAPGAQSVAIAIADLIPHPANRKTFDKQHLEELAANIGTMGILNDLLVRPHPTKAGKHEILAGERRWRGAKMAGLTTVPCKVRDLDDAGALELLLTENLQREDVPPLEELLAYQAYLQQPGTRLEELAAKVAKSESYVRQRLSLSKLVKGAAKQLTAGELPLSHALRIARLVPRDQEKVLAWIKQQSRYRQTLTLVDLDHHIEHEFMLTLAGAPFDTADAALLPDAGACGPCGKRSGAQPGLFADIGQKDTCTDGVCFKLKVAAALAKKFDQLEHEDGKGSVLKLSSEQHLSYGDKYPAGVKVIGADVWETRAADANAKRGLVIHGRIGFGKVVYVTAQRPKAAQREEPSWQVESRKRRKAEAARDARDREIGRRLFAAAAAAIDAPGKLAKMNPHQALHSILVGYAGRMYFDAAHRALDLLGIDTLVGGKKPNRFQDRTQDKVEKWVKALKTPAEIMRAALLLPAVEQVHDGAGDELDQLLKAAGLDTKKLSAKVRAEVLAEEKAKKDAKTKRAKAAAAKKAPPAKKGGKK